MTRFLLLATFLVLLTIAIRRITKHRFLNYWKKLILDKPKIPLFTGEPIWIDCATDMSDFEDYGQQFD